MKAVKAYHESKVLDEDPSNNFKEV